MKTDFNLETTKLNLVSKVFVGFTIAMLCFNIASFSNSVKVHNKTDCTMQVFCDEASINAGVFYMGELKPNHYMVVYPQASYGKVFCKNKRNGHYAQGMDFFNGHYDLYVNKGCSDDNGNDDNPSTPDNTANCENPSLDTCSGLNVLDFSQSGVDWHLNDEGGTYTVGDQTFNISINDPNGIFAAYQGVQADDDDEGSYENETGIAVGINPHVTDDVIEINYSLSQVSDYVAFTIRDLDKKYYDGSQQIEEVCVYGYLGSVEVLPTVTSLCGSVEVNGNCATATTDSKYGDDESIRIVFNSCVDQLKIVYGSNEDAAANPTYSRIFIGDDLGFGAAACDPCSGGPSTPDNTAECDHPTFEGCSNSNILDFTEDGIDWTLNDENGTYTVGDQTFDISLNDPDGIFAAYQQVQADEDDEGSYENNTGLAIGINPHATDDVIEINYNLSLVSDYVAFTIRDLDKKYKYSSQQIEVVCVYGYLDGVEILPTITSLCGSVEIDGNCAVGTTDSSKGEDESIRIVFETCINEIKIVYGNADGAAHDPTYSRIFIGDDIGFGTAICTDECTPCTAEVSEIALVDSNGNICADSNTEINVTVTGGAGENSAWVVTDTLTNIISTTDTPPFTFNAVGTYLIWYLNWDGDLNAAPEIGANAGEIVGASECAALSNSLQITVVECCTATPSEIILNSSGNICINDDVDKPIDVQVNGGSGENSAWVITDTLANILDLPSGPPFILDGAIEGICLIWYLTWDGDLSAMPMIGANAGDILNNSFCAKLSNPIAIIKEKCCTAEASEIVLNSNDSICIDDNIDEPIDVQVNGGSGENSAWVITDSLANILDLPSGPPFILDGATEGICLIWYLTWDGDLSAMPMIGVNAGDIFNDSFCAKLSNPIPITRENCCTAEASEIVLGSNDNVCINDDIDEPIDVQVSGGSGENSAWVITDQNTNILDLPDGPPFILDDEAVGTCLIWYLTWDGDLSAMPMLGANAGDIVNDSFCAKLSNPITITKENCCTAEAASIVIEGGSESLDVCVNDEDLTVISFSLVSPGNGKNSAWVTTDENAIILSVANEVPSLNLYGADIGTIQIWYLNWDGELSAAPIVGANAANIVLNSECAALSNPVIIFKDCCCPFFLEFSEDNLFCNNNILSSRPLLSVDQSLVLDDGTVICDASIISCSADPILFDSNNDRFLSNINTAGVYTAKSDCTCAAPVDYNITQEFLDDCLNFARVAAPVLSVMGITETNATLSYDFDGPVTIEFRPQFDLPLQSIESDLGMVFLAGLSTCTTYEYRAIILDKEGNKVIGEFETFETIGCRNINIDQINVRNLNVRATSAILNWDNVPGCTYTFYYRVVGETEWVNYNTSIPFVVLIGLNPCTNYEWALKVNDDDFVSDISSTQKILTTCEGPRLSDPNALDVKIGDLSDLQNIELDLYLNPSTAILTINFMGLPINDVSIYNANGQLVKTLNISNSALNTIDVSSLTAGAYILVSKFDNGIAKNKFVISK